MVAKTVYLFCASNTAVAKPIPLLQPVMRMFAMIGLFESLGCLCFFIVQK
jgi:hypothetical protein